MIHRNSQDIHQFLESLGTSRGSHHFLTHFPWQVAVHIFFDTAVGKTTGRYWSEVLLVDGHHGALEHLRRFHSYYQMGFIWVLYGFYMVLYGFYMGFIWVLYGFYMGFIIGDRFFVRFAYTIHVFTYNDIYIYIYLTSLSYWGCIVNKLI